MVDYLNRNIFYRGAGEVRLRLIPLLCLTLEPDLDNAGVGNIEYFGVFGRNMALVGSLQEFFIYMQVLRFVLNAVRLFIEKYSVSFKSWLPVNKRVLCAGCVAVYQTGEWMRGG